MSGFLAAHGYDPGPTQRPFAAGAVAGLLATPSAIVVLHLLGSLDVEARILGLPVIVTVVAGGLAMAVAGALYARLLGRAANDLRGGWLFGMAFGFTLWAAGAVFVLPLAGNGELPAGSAATGLFLSLILWGGILGALLPVVHRQIRLDLDDAGTIEVPGPSRAGQGPAKR